MVHGAILFLTFVCLVLLVLSCVSSFNPNRDESKSSNHGTSTITATNRNKSQQQKSSPTYYYDSDSFWTWREQQREALNRQQAWRQRRRLPKDDRDDDDETEPPSVPTGTTPPPTPPPTTTPTTASIMPTVIPTLYYPTSLPPASTIGASKEQEATKAAKTAAPTSMMTTAKPAPMPVPSSSGVMEEQEQYTSVSLLDFMITVEESSSGIIGDAGNLFANSLEDYLFDHLAPEYDSLHSVVVVLLEQQQVGDENNDRDLLVIRNHGTRRQEQEGELGVKSYNFGGSATFKTIGANGKSSVIPEPEELHSSQAEHLDNVYELEVLGNTVEVTSVEVPTSSLALHDDDHQGSSTTTPSSSSIVNDGGGASRGSVKKLGAVVAVITGTSLILIASYFSSRRFRDPNKTGQQGDGDDDAPDAPNGDYEHSSSTHDPNDQQQQEWEDETSGLDIVQSKYMMQNGGDPPADRLSPTSTSSCTAATDNEISPQLPTSAASAEVLTATSVNNNIDNRQLQALYSVKSDDDSIAGYSLASGEDSPARDGNAGGSTTPTMSQFAAKWLSAVHPQGMNIRPHHNDTTSQSTTTPTASPSRESNRSPPTPRPTTSGGIPAPTLTPTLTSTTLMTRTHGSFDTTSDAGSVFSYTQVGMDSPALLLERTGTANSGLSSMLTSYALEEEQETGEDGHEVDYETSLLFLTNGEKKPTIGTITEEFDEQSTKASYNNSNRRHHLSDIANSPNLDEVRTMSIFSQDDDDDDDDDDEVDQERMEGRQVYGHQVSNIRHPNTSRLGISRSRSGAASSVVEHPFDEEIEDSMLDDKDLVKFTNELDAMQPSARETTPHKPSQRVGHRMKTPPTAGSDVSSSSITNGSNYDAAAAVAVAVARSEYTVRDLRLQPSGGRRVKRR